MTLKQRQHLEENDDDYSDRDIMGRMANEDPAFTAEKDLEEFDRMAPMTRQQQEAPDDPDIEDAQNIIKENNDGKGMCID